jgi:HSP20 family protein
MTQILDETIDQIESLYQSVTGQKAPITTKTPYAEIPPEKDPETHVGEQIERLLSSLSRITSEPTGAASWMPPIWASCGPDKLIINVDLPGVPRDAVRIRLANGALQVNGTRTPPAVDGPRWTRYAEQPFGVFQRLIPIPGDVAADQVEAQLKDGVLTIQVPRIGTPALEGKDIPLS